MEIGHHSFLSPKYLRGVFSSTFSWPTMYTLTFCIGCLLSTPATWGAICYLVPYEQEIIHYSGCGCKMNKHGEVLVFGDHPAEDHLKGTSPAGRHWAILKKLKMCVCVCVCVSL